MIHRTLHDLLQAAAQKSRIISVTGPRQSGKTTLVRAVFGDYTYVNFEDLGHRAFATEDPASFLKTHGKRMILDEIQHVPGLFSYLQLSTDNDAEMRIVITGSQNLLLHQKISQSMSGRVALFTLLPFSLSELDNTPYSRQDYEDYIFTGFYPRIYDENPDPGKWLNDYIQTYVERDVRQLTQVDDLHRFQQFLKLCAGHIGQTVNFSSFGNALGISYHTAQRWLSVLEAGYIVFRLHPFHQNFNKRLVKTPKLYFYDTGIASLLLGIKSTDQVPVHFARGMLFENLVIADMIKSGIHAGIRSDFYFWRDNSGNEVDLIIDEGMRRKAVEIKSSRVINSDFFNGLSYWSRTSGASPGDLFLVYGGEENQVRVKASVSGWKNASRMIL
ncbi:MAG TPA: ATP-binding protein [Bacteroidales bacterium]|nr:ATP-binding protein [Bacteroidales bacterium]